MNVCIVNFSGRGTGNCHDIAVVIEKTIHEKGGTVKFIELCDLDISPCGNCNYNCFKRKEDCPFINDDISYIYNLICSSDQAYYVVPNYCDFPSSLFFIFNERSQSYFQNDEEMLYHYLGIEKKFVIVSNTEEENFQQAFKYHVSENSELNLLFLSANNFNKVSIEGGLMESEQAKNIIIDYVNDKKSS